MGRAAIIGATGSAASLSSAGSAGANLTPHHEIPQGVIDGANTDFTLTAAPDFPYILLDLNGVEQDPLNSPADYTLSGNTITYTIAPKSGDRHKAFYFTGVNGGTGKARAFNGPAAPGTGGTSYPVIATASLPGGVVGQAYSASLSATGGTSPYAWTITAGSLPTGLSLSGATISGTPTTAGVSNITVQVADSTPKTATRQYTITITAAAGPLTVQTTSLPSDVIGQAYSQSLLATGGSTPYSWTVSAGSLPVGLSLSSGGAITGTPSGSPGTATFTVQVTDSASAVATQDLSITIVASGGTLAVLTTSLPTGVVGTAYTATLAATGGTTPYSWSITSGSLPAGLSLSGDAISGTPTAAGHSPITIQVTDAASATASRSITLYVVLTLAVTSYAASGTVGQPFTATLSASGGATPYTWSIVSGSLPAGLTLSGDTISGNPTGPAGTSSITFQVTDSAGNIATGVVAITINDNSSGPPGFGGPMSAAYLSQNLGSSDIHVVVTPIPFGAVAPPTPFMVAAVRAGDDQSLVQEYMQVNVSRPYASGALGAFTWTVYRSQVVSGSRGLNPGASWSSGALWFYPI